MLNNARNNDTAMQKLSELLAECGIKFDHVDWCIMCLPHVLNICSKHVMEEYTDADFAAVSDTWVNALSDVVNKDKYIEALQHDPVALGRDIVQIIRSSSLCCEGFTNTIATGNQMSWFTDEEGQPSSNKQGHRWQMVAWDGVASYWRYGDCSWGK